VPGLGDGDVVEDRGVVAVGERGVQVVRQLLLLRGGREGGTLLVGECAGRYGAAQKAPAVVPIAAIGIPGPGPFPGPPP